MKLILISLAAALTFSSCSTYRKTVDAISEKPELVGPAVALVVNTVFSKSLSPEDAKEKAVQIDKAADKILNLKFDSKPTKDEVAALLAEALPGGWGAALAYSVSGYYEKYTAKLESADVEKAVVILKAVAGGLKVSAAKYL